MSKEVGCEIHLKLPSKGLTEEEVMNSLQKYALKSKKKKVLIFFLFMQIIIVKES